MRTLRGRLILSHTLPFLLVVPLIGALLIYILDTQLLLTDLSGELLQQAVEMADGARTQPAIWYDTGQAQQFVTLYSVRSRSQVMLVDANGNLLAASDPTYKVHRGQPMELPYLLDALAGEQQVHVRYGQALYADIVQVLVPVVGPNQQVVGVVQLSQNLSALSDQFARLRLLILAVLGAELVLGMLIGLVLALGLGRSLRRARMAYLTRTGPRRDSHGSARLQHPGGATTAPRGTTPPVAGQSGA
jgi:sensor histidine kinase regulating citrate/malate metabolism